MKCEDIKIALSEFVDNELNFNKHSAIKEHIDGCEQCSREVDNLSTLKNQLARFESSLSSDFEFKLHQRINKVNHKSRFHKFLPLAASIILIVPLVHYLAFMTAVTMLDGSIHELKYIGKTTSSDDEQFHKWTQLDDSNKKLACSGSAAGSDCFVEIPYVPGV
ncbi:anti-sigma factor family protein [Colwellia psychrerythraea]|uniref:Putative zinc-finger domain-containing protein n=1 Tax=Colwellia psychrerythraea TaxID=28229 RepID=A0A099L1A6_COLPS|nr:zf-HC2 domain-containing protein [Colwellia psychrerythraea]KGJ95927.1 hypothetical protein GAB14E_1839 [Colwellia psychrerythraea]